MKQPIFTTLKSFSFFGAASIDIYAMKPHSSEKKHFHTCWEFVYVHKGSCKTHKKYSLHIYPPKKIHEVINNSDSSMIFICLTIPPESEKNTYYL